MIGHECNAYCCPAEQVHCELMWTNPGLDRAHIWQSLASNEGVWVVGVQPAREPWPAPRKDEEGYNQIAGIKEATEPRLVYYRTDYKQARAEYEAGVLPEWPA